MQVPERLALIGGGILLSSTLIFSLKGQASQLLPKVSHNVSSVYQDITDTQAEHGGLSFNDAYQNAEHHGWKTGQWGTSKYYIDDKMNMHIGAGKLSQPLYDTVGDEYAHKISTITLDENIQAPGDSSNLFAGRNYHAGFDTDSNYSITQINGLKRLDVSQATTTINMFYRNWNLSTPMDLNNWDMSKVESMNGMFGNTSISSFNIKDWNVSNVDSMGWMFFNLSSVRQLDLSGWCMNTLNGANNAFSGDSSLTDINLQNFKTGYAGIPNLFGMGYSDTAHSINKITLGNDARFQYSNINYFPDGTWKSGNQMLSNTQLMDGNSHPGTWAKQ